MKNRQHLFLPVLLIALGLWLMVGCIYVPHLSWKHNGPDYAASVGGPKSNRPIRKLSATRSDVLNILGKPRKTDPGNKLVYTMSMEKGLVVYPLCFFISEPSYGTRNLVLTFDENDILTDYEIKDSMN